MKLTIGNGTPIELERGIVAAEGGCVVLHEDTTVKATGLENGRFLSHPEDTKSLVLIYRLRDGESLRRVREGEYEIVL